MAGHSTHTLDVPGARLTYDVHRPVEDAGHRPLFVFGSPMAASGFPELTEAFSDRTVITYDPRGAERSILDAEGEISTERHAGDLHAIVAETGLGPVDAFASSGGAQNALAWATAHPADLHTLVAHEPPLVALLEDWPMIERLSADIAATYAREGYGPAMAKFISFVMHTGPVTEDYFAEAAPDPAQFGLPTEDDGSRDDLLLSRAMAVPPYRPDAAALQSSGVRIVPAIGALGEGTPARRGGEAFAELLGAEPEVFPGDHGGFTANPYAPDSDPAAFARHLRTVLDG